jgi:hypothetical protein
MVGCSKQHTRPPQPPPNHGFHDQYPEQFADDIVEFLNR